MNHFFNSLRKKSKNIITLIKGRFSHREKLSDLDEQIVELQKSTKTTFKALNKTHNFLRTKSKPYYDWHLFKHRELVHAGVLITSIILMVTLVFNSIYTPQVEAANYTKTWSDTTDFNTGTNTNLDITNNQAKLASTTTNFSEGFTNTTYKDAASDATWDTSTHKLTLPGDPNSGVATDIQAAWKNATGVTEIIQASTYDSTNHFIYLGGDQGSFIAYNPANSTAINLTTKIFANWSTTYFNDMTFDSTNGKVYFVGGSGKFGVFTGGADPANGTWVYLYSKINSEWGGANTTSVVFDSVNSKVYLGGSIGKFGVFTGGADPANGTWVYLNSKITADWSTDFIYSLTFDSVNGKVYLGGLAGKFGVFTGGSDPANGTWVHLTAKISAIWLTDTINALTFDSTNGKVYLGGGSGKFGVFTGGADPANGTWINLSAKISSWSSSSIYAMTFDSINGKVYLGGGSGKFGAFTGGSDPANGTWVYLTAKISADWSTNSMYAMTFDSINSKVYFGGVSGKFGSFTGGSDPVNGTWTYLASNVAGGFNGYRIASSATDTTNNIVYLGGDSGRLVSYKVSDGTWINLSSKVVNGAYVIGQMMYDSTNHFIYYAQGWTVEGGSSTFILAALPTLANPSDATGVTLITKKPAAWADTAITALTTDTTSGYIYLGTYGGQLGSFASTTTPATITITDLTAKISTDWSTSGINIMAFDSTNGKVYLAGGSGRFGVFTGGADPANGVYVHLASKISSMNYIYAMAFDSTNSKVYLGGNSGNFGVFTGGANPANGTWVYLNSKISATWSSSNAIYAMVFFNNKVYLGGVGGQFGSFAGTSDPANGNWTYQSASISSFWGTSIIYTLTSSAAGPGVYLGGGYGKAASYIFGFASNKNGLSVAVDGTAKPVLQATLTATETKPANTGITYYLSNNGGSNWTEVTSGTPYTFATAGSDLRWKANMTTTNIVVTPEVTAVAISYIYYTSSTGTLNLTYDASQAVVLSRLSASLSTPTNTTLSFKLRGAATQVGLASATWSSAIASTALPKDLRTVTVGGATGFADNQWSEVQADFATTDDLNTPVLNDLTLTYVINAVPEIQALTATQTLDGTKKVNIGYQLRDTDTDINPYNEGQVAISFQYSIDSGSNWLDCNTITNTGLKDVSQADFTPYTSVWDINTDLANTYYNGTVKIKALINDNEQAHNTAELISSLFSVDTKNPVANAITGGGVGVKINDGTSWSNNQAVDLTLSATDDTAKYMEIRNDTNFTGVKEDYATAKTGWTLSNTDGNKTVYVRFYDAFGNTVDASSNILLDTTAPDLPIHFTIYDISDMQLGAFSTIATWNPINNPTDFSLYSIERSTVTAPWAELATLSNISSDVYYDKGLTNTDTYSYRIRSKDIHNNYSAYSDVKSMQPAGVDTIPPEITGTGPTPEAGDTTATISWTTDKPSDSYVEYGTTTDYGQIQGSDELSLNHVVTIVGLSPTTTYQFRVKCRDVAGNRVVSANATFTTTLPAESAAGVTITGSTAQKPGADPEEVTVIWTTDRYATSQVKYGTKEGVLDMVTPEDATLNKTHYVNIAHLNPNTKYYYQAYSKDTYGNEVLGELKYFVTAQSGLSTPTIMSVKATDVTLASAIISWQTTTVATSVVEYGTDIGSYTGRIEDKSLGSTTQHVIRLDQLESGKEYHYRVLGLGTDQRWIASDDYLFATVSMPAISEVKVKEIASTIATVTWKTNIDITSTVLFGTDELTQSQGDAIASKEHSVTLRALAPATKYNFQLKATDSYGNTATSETQSFQTIIDTTPPVIRDMKSEASIISDPNGDVKAQVIVSWSTDEPSTSLVKYAMGVVANDAYPLATNEETNLTTSHIMIITGLQPSATYHMRLISKDASGNLAASDDYTILTLNQDKSLLQYIIQILEERFSWAKGMGIFK